MKGDRLPPQHFVARHCRYSDLVWLHGQPVAVTESAFRPRADEVDGLSVNWVDFFRGPKLHQIDCIRSVTKLQVRDSHRLAIVQIQDIQQAASPVSLTAVEDPDAGLPPKFNAAHALVQPIGELNDVANRQKLASRVKPVDLICYR